MNILFAVESRETRHSLEHWLKRFHRVACVPTAVDMLSQNKRSRYEMLIVDETRHTGGVGEGVLAELLEHGFTGAVDRVASRDSFIPLGDAALEVLLSEDTIEAAAIKLVGEGA